MAPPAFLAQALGEGYEDFRRFVNPLHAARAELTGEPFRFQRVRDGVLVDDEGREAHDFLAGWGTQAFGHRPRAIAEALTAYLASDAPSFFTSLVSPYAGLLARRLCERTGGHYTNTYLMSGGAEAVEAGLRLARAATGRPRVLSLSGAYHGCTMGANAMMAPGHYRDAFGPHLPEVVALPFGDLPALEEALGSPLVAAVVVEPWQVESGVRPLPPAYLAALCEQTARRGVLLMADEIQTGLGRTGRFLASEGWPRRPDLVALGKALGGGLVPVSALLTTQEHFQRAYGSHLMADAHNSTFSGNALACVAALAALELLDEPLLARVREAGARFRAALAETLAGSSLVRLVRGDGLLVGLELNASDHPFLSFEYLGLADYAGQPAVGALLGHRLFRRGFLTNVCGHQWQTVRLQPPLTLSDQVLEAFVAACREEVDYLASLTG